MLYKILRAANSTYPGLSAKSIISKTKFLFVAFYFRKAIKKFYSRLKEIGSLKVMDTNPSVLGAIKWPYINKVWEVEERLWNIATHYEIVKQLPPAFSIDGQKPICIVDLCSFSSDIKVVLDRPIWFIREGEIVLNLFKKELRVVSIAFIFSKNINMELSIFIGAIQGIHRGVPSEESLTIFKSLTKDFAGLRPRTLLLEILRNIAIFTNTKHIFAVAENCRQHYHSFFGVKENKKLRSNYDNIWTDHGGVPGQLGFFEIPLEIKRKPISERPSKKRAMYRRREKILSSIKELILTKMTIDV